MTAPQLANSDAPTPKNRRYTYHFIPQLRELLPKQQGRPGVTYLQASVTNLRRAEDDDWFPIEGTVTYTIVGPKGSIDVKLMGRGKAVPGVGHASGKRRCEVDILIEQVTGHLIKSKPINFAAPTNGSASKKAS